MIIEISEKDFQTIGMLIGAQQKAIRSDINEVENRLRDGNKIAESVTKSLQAKYDALADLGTRLALAKNHQRLDS